MAPKSPGPGTASRTAIGPHDTRSCFLLLRFLFLLANHLTVWLFYRFVLVPVAGSSATDLSLGRWVL